MLNRRHREALRLGLRGDDIYKYIYGIDSNRSSIEESFKGIPNELDVMNLGMKECTEGWDWRT